MNQASGAGTSTVAVHGARASGARLSPTVPFASLLARGARAANAAGHAGLASSLGAGRGGEALRGTTRAAAEGGLDAAAPGQKQGSGDAGEGASEEEPECDGESAKGASADELDQLDPLARHAAQLAPPATIAPPIELATAAANEPVRARSLEELLPALVRRIAWAGDRHKGTVRLELGAGVYAGTTVTVHADAGRVRVEIGGREGPDLDRLRARLDARLRGHGLDVESVT